MCLSTSCWVQADKYFMMKSQILETLGFGPKEQFPVYADRFPNQLLAYLRLSRIADPALFAKVGSGGQPSACTSGAAVGMRYARCHMGVFCELDMLECRCSCAADRHTAAFLMQLCRPDVHAAYVM